MPTFNQVEMLEVKFLALCRRVDSLESWRRSSMGNGKDVAAADAVALELGFDSDIFVQAFKVLQRRQLARALRDRGFSASRIAKVMGCCERTAERWIEPDPNSLKSGV